MALCCDVSGSGCEVALCDSAVAFIRGGDERKATAYDHLFYGATKPVVASAWASVALAATIEIRTHR